MLTNIIQIQTFMRARHERTLKLIKVDFILRMENMRNALKRDRKPNVLFILAKHRPLFGWDSFILAI